ncbi:MAG: YafY family protein [Rhodothermales bacterium]|nr:YafY family protein [Rhodothermales bacterium]
MFALVLLLQNRPNMTSRDLAEHFGVSRRTIFRDLRALGESGVPLTYADEGGYEILEGYQLPPLMLSAREAATLLVGIEFMKRQPDASLVKDADEVGLKIRSVLPKPVQEYIDRLRSRTVIDPYWFETMKGGDAEEGFWYDLSEAVAHQRSVQMDYYVMSRDEVTRRRVDPLGLVYYTDHWNLIAYDHLRDDIRNFRLDRMQKLFVSSQRFERPANFDLARYLEDQGAGPEQRIELQFAEPAYRWAKRSIPAKIEEERAGPDGVTVIFYFENLDYLAHWLLRYGTQVRVIEPASLRERLGRQAKALLEHHEQERVVL